jgi:4,5-DOPA dioxygenase extradiol
MNDMTHMIEDKPDGEWRRTDGDGSGAFEHQPSASRIEVQLEQNDPGRLHPHSRRVFLTTAATAALGLAVEGSLSEAFQPGSKENSMSNSPGRAAPQSATRRMPVVFVGHGSPMNVIEDNQWSRGFAALCGETPRPKAILAISAHWFVSGTYLTGNAAPRTIHDFGGFPKALYEVTYPAPGKRDLATHVRALLGEEQAALSTDWGLDHGTWSVLKWMYPQADVPVVQLSIDRRLDVRSHYELGRSLAELREEGVLILGSGNVVHNLGDAIRRMQTGSSETPPWARRFDATVADILLQRDSSALLSALSEMEDGQLAHPIPDHWLPLIYTFAATDDADRVRFPTEGFDLGSISMRNAVFG